MHLVDGVVGGWPFLAGVRSYSVVVVAAVVVVVVVVVVVLAVVVVRVYRLERSDDCLYQGWKRHLR